MWSEDAGAGARHSYRDAAHSHEGGGLPQHLRGVHRREDLVVPEERSDAVRGAVEGLEGVDFGHSGRRKGIHVRTAASARSSFSAAVTAAGVRGQCSPGVLHPSFETKRGFAGRQTEIVGPPAMPSQYI